MADKLARNLMREDATLREVMARLDEGIGGIVLVVDGAGALRGVFTDGDVRRALLAGCAMDAPAGPHMNTRYQSCPAGTPREQILAMLSHKVRQVPVLDDAGRPVDLLSWLDFWRMSVASPTFGGNELKYVSDCIARGWISSQGDYVGRFEERFAALHGGGHAVSTTNGTTALHLALVALRIGPGDEVIVPNLTFGATANAVLQCGATPVFADVDARTWGLDPAAVERVLTERTRALMPVHLYGHPCDMDPLMEIARRRKLFVIEDCAEALDTRYRGRLVGTIGDAGCYSFFANKIITTGEGGMVLAKDEAVAKRLRMLRDHGMQPGRRYWHLELGFNYRMTNLQAAVGVAQLEQLAEFRARRDAVAARYRERLGRVAGIMLPPAEPWAEPICWLFSILLDESISRDRLRKQLAERGIETRELFYPLNIQPAFGSGDERACPVSARLARQGMSLPTSAAMTLEDVDVVCGHIESLIGQQRLARSAAAGGAR